MRGFAEETWAEHRHEIVVTGTRGKFRQHQDLRDFLLATGDKLIVEASPVDTIWGIGLDEHRPEARRPSQWRGLNLLGFAIMDVRAELAGL